MKIIVWKGNQPLDINAQQDILAIYSLQIV